MNDNISNPLVFISYAREDLQTVLKLYEALKERHIRVWIDVEDSIPGKDWRYEIERVIREEADFVLLCLSKNSIDKRGYVQTESRIALNVLDELPIDEIFMIPIRLEECSPIHPTIKYLTWVDLFKNWEKGFKNILRALNVEPKRHNKVRETIEPSKTKDNAGKDIVKPKESKSISSNKSIDPFLYAKGRIPRYLPVNTTLLSMGVGGFTDETTNEDMVNTIRNIDDSMASILWDDYYWAERSNPNDLIITTGNVYDIVFHPHKFGSKLILSITEKLFGEITDKSDMPVKMALAKGPLIRYLDMNGIISAFGYAVHIAHMLLNLANKKQILVSDEFASAALSEQHIPELTFVGGCRDQYNKSHKVYNYYKKNAFGNESLLFR